MLVAIQRRLVVQLLQVLRALRWILELVVFGSGCSLWFSGTAQGDEHDHAN